MFPGTERVGASDEGGLVLHMASPTHYANLMMRVMVARKLSDHLPGLTVSNVDLPYWNISAPTVPMREHERVCRLTHEQHVPFERIRYLSEAGIVTRVDWHGYGQRLENFPDKATCRDIFRADASVGVELSDDCLLCPIRAGEILDAIHPGYTVVPVEFYEEIVEETGLRPVFMGQLSDNSFVRKLRSRFPRAEYLPHNSAIEDFQTIRKARHVILPVSTFAWLAAWLSQAESIVLPVFGIFNPRLFSLHDLLPLAEAPYRFYQFPDQPAVALADLDDAHRQIKGQWHRVQSYDLVPADI